MGNLPSFPVAEHFNKPGHRLDNMMVRYMKQCSSINNARHRDKMCLINGLNMDLIFLNSLMCVHFNLSIRVA